MLEKPPRPRPANLAPLETLRETARGTVLPLPARLERLYGSLRMPKGHPHPHVYSNFVTTLDGVVSLQEKGHASGGDISGHSAQDRMVMGLLRAVADVVIIGSGTLRVDRGHVWTAEAIYPELARDYRRLRQSLGMLGPPLNVVVSGSGAIDLRLPVFTSGKVPAMVITTSAGAKSLRRKKGADSIPIRAIGRGAGAIPARAILDELCRAGIGGRILVEGGPILLRHFYAERLVHEQFLTVAPQIAGREAGDRRLSLVMGKEFAPRDALWGALVDLRRGGSHLFLRYSFATG